MKSTWSFLQTGGAFEPSCSSSHLLFTLLPPPDPNQRRYRLNFAGLASNHLLINDVVVRVHAGISGLGIKWVTWNQLKTMPGQRNRPHVKSQVNNTCPGRYGKLNSRWAEWKAHGLQLERLGRTRRQWSSVLTLIQQVFLGSTTKEPFQIYVKHSLVIIESNHIRPQKTKRQT